MGEETGLQRHHREAEGRRPEALGHLSAAGLRAFGMSQGPAADAGIFRPRPCGLILSFRGNHLARGGLGTLKSYTDVLLPLSPRTSSSGIREDTRHRQDQHEGARAHAQSPACHTRTRNTHSHHRRPRPMHTPSLPHRKEQYLLTHSCCASVKGRSDTTRAQWATPLELGPCRGAVAGEGQGGTHRGVR